MPAPATTSAGPSSWLTAALCSGFKLFDSIGFSIARHQILAVTFTEKAAAEMEERLDVVLPYGQAPRVMTFNAFGDELIREFGHEIGYGAIKLLTSYQQTLFLKQRFDELQLEYFAPIGNPTSLLADLAAYFARLKEELIEPAIYLDWAKAQAQAASDEASRLEATKQLELARAYGAYDQAMAQAGQIDFADQIRLSLRLLSARPNVLKRLRQQLKYILVDEFQDTNFAQARLMEEIAGPDGNIMVVGDDDQSIYKFRGAAISNILGFKERYPKAKQIVLTKNYRSSQAILDAAYRLIQQNNPDRLEAKNQIDKRLKARSQGRPPVLNLSATVGLEAEWLAQDVSRRVKAGEEPGQIGILVRKRSQARIVISALEKADIAYQYGGEEALFEQPIIRLMLSFLQYIVDPKDDASLYYILTSKVFNQPPSLLAQHASQARREHQPLTLRLTEAEPSIREILAQFERWRELARDLPVGQLLYRFIDETGYLNRLAKAAQSEPLQELEIKRLSKYFGMLDQFQQVSTDQTAYGYVDALGLLDGGVEVTHETDAESSKQLVQVMTIHKAKGLEFETVYIFDLSAGTFPTRLINERLIIPSDLMKGEALAAGDWHLAEERRLMYVAMTRAKRNLILSFSPDHGGVRSKKPSIFLVEALGELPELSAQTHPAALEQISLFAPTKSGEYGRLELPDQLELTVHQIDDYLDCPLNYYWKYVLNVPQPTQASQLYGTAMHAVINHYFKRRAKGPVDLEELLDYFEKTWRREGYPSIGQIERRYNLARATIERFWRREEVAKRWPSQLEQSFKVNLSEKVALRGRYDAVYTEADGAEIRDYKTSQITDEAKAQKQAKSSRQLALYALGWWKDHGEVPKVLALDFIETGLIGLSSKSQPELVELESQVLAVAKSIRAGEFEPGKNHFNCIHDKL